MRAVRRRRRPAGSRGQSLTELAISVPILMVLLVGVAQVGALVYGAVTVDTAARDGARVAAQQPNNSGAYSNGAPVGTTVTCTTASTNPVCVAVVHSSGLVSGAVTTIKAEGCPGACANSPSCQATWVQDGEITVTVSYAVPVFIPLLGRVLADPGLSTRTVSAVVTVRVEPCTITEGR